MTRYLLIGVVASISIAISAGVSAAAQGEPTPRTEQPFLQKAAEGQQVEIALGRLALQKASNEQVKQFGARMIQDHQKASEEVRQLATKEGISLPALLNTKHQQMQQELAQLSGKEFDKAYISSMVRDHVKDLEEFEQGAQTLKDPQVKQWSAGTLPILKDHLERAKAIAAMIGVNAG